MLCQILCKLCSKELSDPIIKLISSKMGMLSCHLFPRMVAFGSKGLLLSMQRINILNMILNGRVWKNADSRVSCTERHKNNILPRLIVGFGPTVTYSCCCKGVDVYHTLNIRTCWIDCSMGTESCMVNFQISTSLINHFSYYIDFYLEKSERHIELVYMYQSLPVFYKLNQGGGKLLCQRPDSKYLRHCGPLLQLLNSAAVVQKVVINNYKRMGMAFFP